MLQKTPIRPLFPRAAALLLSATLLASTAETVDRIDFAGNRTLSRQQLLAAMQTTPRTLWRRPPFDRRQLRDDLSALRTLYRENGFSRADVQIAALTTDTTNQSVDILLRIREGPRTVIGALFYDWNELLPDSVLDKVTKHRAGAPCVSELIRDDARRIEQFLATRGLLLADVGVVRRDNDRRDTAWITFLVDEGPLVVAGDIATRGLERVKRVVVLNELLFQPGDTLTSALVQESHRRLNATALFKHVDIDIHDTTTGIQPGTPCTLPLTIRLDEREMFRYYLSASFAPFDLLRLTGSLNYANLFGLGHSLGLAGQVSATLQSVNLSYTTQSLPFLPLSVSPSAFFQRRDEETYEGSFGGTRLTFAAESGPHASYWLRLKAEWTADVQAPAAPALLPARRNQSTYSTALGFSYDQRSASPFPILGARATAQAEAAGITGLGSNRFLKLWADLRGYLPLFNLPIGLVTGINAGLITDLLPNSERLPPQELFGVAQGPIREVRGYERDEIGPRNDMGEVIGGQVALVFTVAEFRVPLYREFVQAILFWDAGQVWGDPDKVDLGELQWSVGPGVRLSIGGTLIGIDYGFQLFTGGGGRVHLSAESRLTAVR